MTYVANRNNSNLEREQVRWNTEAGEIVKIAAWAVPAGVHAAHNLPAHCDMYQSPHGWAVSLDEAISLGNYTDTAELDLADQIINETLIQLHVGVPSIDPDGEDATFEIRLNDKFQGSIHGSRSRYTLVGWLFDGQIFDSPECAAIAYCEMHFPVATELAKAAAIRTVLDRQLLPDYM